MKTSKLNICDQVSLAPNGKLLACSDSRVLKVCCVSQPVDQTNHRNKNIIEDNLSETPWQCSIKCLDVIDTIVWSPDSRLLLTTLPSKSTIQVWSVEDESWRCKVDEGTTSFSHVQWLSDSSHILSLAASSLRITIWSLTSANVLYIKHVKLLSPPTDAFSVGTSLLAVCERRGERSEDSVSIFDTNTWRLATTFPSQADHVKTVEWSPDCSMLAVWSEPAQCHLSLYSCEGVLLGVYSQESCTLGISNLKWAPHSHLCSTTNYASTKVSLINSLTVTELLSFTHPHLITSKQTIVYKETEDDINSVCKYSLVEERPVVMYRELLCGDDLYTSLVSHMSYSHNGRYMATVLGFCPHIVWVWQIGAVTNLHSTLTHLTAVQNVVWGDDALYMLCVQGGRRRVAGGTVRINEWSEMGGVTIHHTNIGITQAAYDISNCPSSLSWCKSRRILLGSFNQSEKVDDDVVNKRKKTVSFIVFV